MSVKSGQHVQFRNHAFIVGSLKVGTTLLLSLLEGHRDALAFPFELKYHKLFHTAAGGALGKARDLNAFFLTESKFTHFRKDLHDDPYNTGMLDFSGVDYGRLTGYLDALPKEDYQRSEYFEELARSYMYATGDSREMISCLIEKPGNHALDYIDTIYQDFPGAKIIHLVRDPRTTLSSAKNAVMKYNGVWGQYEPNEILEKILQGFEVARKYGGTESYKVIRYEDLVARPREVVEDLLKWLGLPWDENCLRPTFLGRTWQGNSSSDTKFQAPSVDRVESPTGELTAGEDKWVEIRLARYLREYSYSQRHADMPVLERAWMIVWFGCLRPLFRKVGWTASKLVRLDRYPAYIKKWKQKRARRR
ncbi:MAG: sulfotransferase [Candidatus Omnitrophica bacterium]|nr:sulfotransferase [Candidatus Omnitrophota bacterium]